MKQLSILFFCLAIAACGRIDNVGKAPDFTPVEDGNEYYAMSNASLRVETSRRQPADSASLWSGVRFWGIAVPASGATS